MDEFNTDIGNNNENAGQTANNVADNACVPETENTAPVSGQTNYESKAEETAPRESAAENTAPAEEAPHSWSEPNYTTVNSQPKYDTYSPNHHNVSGEYSTGYSEPVPPVKKPKKKKNHGFLKALCIILACVLLSSVSCYFIAGYVADVKLGSIESPDAPAGNKTVVIGGDNSAIKGEGEGTGAKTADDDILSAKQIYSLAQEQVVGISTSVTTTNFFGQVSSSAVTGTGFIISSDGYIMTNYHVVEYGVAYGSPVTVIMHDGTKYEAKIVGYKADNDVAVVKIDADDLNAVEFSTDLEVGEQVYAVGNPLGELTYTMTTGIVSALDRVITTQNSTTGETQSINMFQIDAAINSGNSGGPVYNEYGQVVGMATAKYSSNGIEGLGFAIPIEDALNIATQILEKGYVTGAYLGVKISDVDKVYSSFAIEYYGYPEGACVMSVEEDGAAEVAGIQTGDIITAMGDYAVDGTNSLRAALKKFKPGDTVTVKVYRFGATIDTGDYVTLNVTLGETSATETEQQTQQQNQQNQMQQQIIEDAFGNQWNFGS